MQELNCRGLACPAPVTQVRDLLVQGKPSTLAVLVDNEAARENVSRFLAYQGYQVMVEEVDEGFKVIGTGGDQACEVMDEKELAAAAGAGGKILVMITTDRLGHGDDQLGSGLMLNFLKTLKEMGPELWRLVFINAGVKLTVAGAETLAPLQELATGGVSILVCGTCLNHFNLLDQKQVGETTNMLDIVTSLQLADKVINV
ncbi:sulfurtransferase-like selenium metabolism protein YedF [Desulfurivibrio alkaliphilus]|uniref:Selenium metabolism protein YedF n=1 Tax=Desulfurivibrio alkaliphilus (strain DSM 19089 / UNIQEM U267 / AHT2) TaxID=589865 RepID=D6Z5W7_DESAT|nr:sulfurtransferase-like selenium metabolism protein YedF [Desulfurivibrio alkaliphilus]ADH84849.1 selenium metabolism protein YedF [Desulfurivibrio alkaliphilus AHT 2]